MSTNSREIRCALFDMDGTLMDSMIYWRALLLREIDILFGDRKEYTEELRQHLFFVQFEETQVILEKTFGKKPREQGFDFSYMHRMMECFYRDKAVRREGAVNILQRLHESGVKTGLLTATKAKLAMPPLERLGLLPFLDFIYTPDEYKLGKGDPKIFEDAMAYCGATPAETVFYEDSVYSMRTAKNLGIRVCAIYDHCSQRDEEEIRRIADEYYDFGKGVTEVPEEDFLRYEEEMAREGWQIHKRPRMI